MKIEFLTWIFGNIWCEELSFFASNSYQSVGVILFCKQQLSISWSYFILPATTINQLELPYFANNNYQPYDRLKTPMQLPWKICNLSHKHCIVFFFLYVRKFTLRLQDLHARPCYTVTSIIDAQISLVPRLPLSFLLALPVIKKGCHSTCDYTPYSITSKATT